MTRKDRFRQVARESLCEQVALKLIGRPEKEALTNQKELVPGRARRVFQANELDVPWHRERRKSQRPWRYGERGSLAWSPHPYPRTYLVTAIDICKDSGFVLQAVRGHSTFKQGRCPGCCVENGCRGDKTRSSKSRWELL